jgi:REP element-mobilizing transposase RayT
MSRRMRCSDGGFVYHVLNRAVGRATIFAKSADYAAFEKVLQQAWERTQMRLLAYVLVPNHWHLVVWPSHDGQLSTYAQWLTVTHVRRWHAHHHTQGTGPVYQGRFRSFPVQADGHFLSLCRYVERNALRRSRTPRGPVALVEFVAPLPGDGRAVVARLARAKARRLAAVCEQARDGKRTGGPAAVGAARGSLRG